MSLAEREDMNCIYCDGWEAQFCCTLCEYHGGGDCENCDPMDI